MDECDSKTSKKRVWTWHPNIYDLKTTTVDTSQIWNCSPYIMICSGVSEDEDPEIVVTIEMNRDFKWTKNNGWTWHKTWKMPTINVSMGMFDKMSMQEIECPINLELQLYAAKLVTNNANMMYFHTVPLKGETFLTFKDGRAVLEGIKFDTTSYNHNVKERFYTRAASFI